MLVKESNENYLMLKWLDKFIQDHKGFICGGCFKNIFNKEKVKDLDIFFLNGADFEDAVRYYDSQKETKLKMADSIHQLTEMQLKISDSLYRGLN